jgi:putative membrane protein
MKCFIKKITAAALGILLTIAFPVNALALTGVTKEEAVYVNLAYDGSVENIYVVNAFDLTEDGTVTDYGQYSQTRNMSTDQAIHAKDGVLNFRASKGRFYYQGNMTGRDIPWTIKIDYLLNGVPVKADGLAGKSGSLEIKMSIRQNKSVNEVFFKHFALQAVFTLDADKCRDIVADGATIADAGGDKLITFTVLPDKEKDLSVKANVSDFSMDGIQIKGIPLSLDIDSPDTSELKDRIYDLQDGATDLDDGADDLHDGTGDLKDGVNDLKTATNKLKSGADRLKKGAKQLKDGIADLSGKSNALVQGSAQVKAALKQMDEGLNQLSSLKDGLARLKTASEQYLKSIGDLKDKTETLPAASKGIYDAIKQCRDALASASAHDGEMAAVVNSLKGSADPDVQALITAYEQKSSAIVQVRTGLSSLASQYDDFNSGISQTAAAVDQLASAYTEIKGGIQQIAVDGLLQLATGIETLAAQYDQLDGGITEYTGAFGKIASGYNGVYSGVADLADGISAMQSGVKELSGGADDLNDGAGELSEGTQELKDETADMDTEVDDKVNEMIDKYTKQDYTLVSFVSEKNTNIKLVQFVIKTDDIEIPDKTAPASDEPAANPAFWDKFIALFK